MTQFLYVLQFKGKARPANEAGTILKALTTAASCRVTTTIGPDGLATNLQPAGDGCASLIDREAIPA